MADKTQETTSIPLKIFDQHVAILGKTGSGKTTTAKGAVERLLDIKERCCIFDPTGVWWGLKSNSTGKKGAYPVIVFGGDHADVAIGRTHGEAIAEIVGTSSTSSIIDVSMMNVSERTQFFTDFANELLKKNKGSLHLILDEAHLVAPQGRVVDPQSGKMLHAANNLVSLGRSRGLKIVLITQRPAKLHKDSLTQVEAMIAMRLVAPQDRNAVNDWVRDQADEKQGKDIIASLPTLKTGEGWVWAPELNMLERMKFKMIKTFDTSKAPSAGDKKGSIVLAPIDLKTINSKLEVVAKEAAINDPKKLKAKIFELEKQLKSKSTTNGTFLDAKEIDRIQKSGYDKGYDQALDDNSMAFSAAIATLASKVHRSISETKLSSPSRKTVFKKHISIPAKAIITFDKAPKTGEKIMISKSIQSSKISNLSSAHLKIIRALHFWHSIGQDDPSRSQVAAVAGYSVTSGGYGNLLSQLSVSGAISYPRSGVLKLTSIDPSLEMSTSEARDAIMSILTTPLKRLVSAVVDHGAEPISRDELAEKSGFSSTSGGYGNLISKLSVLNIFERPASGFVKLTDWALEVLS